MRRSANRPPYPTYADNSNVDSGDDPVTQTGSGSGSRFSRSFGIFGSTWFGSRRRAHAARERHNSLRGAPPSQSRSPNPLRRRRRLSHDEGRMTSRTRSSIFDNSSLTDDEFGRELARAIAEANGSRPSSSPSQDDGHHSHRPSCLFHQGSDLDVSNIWEEQLSNMWEEEISDIREAEISRIRDEESGSHSLPSRWRGNSHPTYASNSLPFLQASLEHEISELTHALIASQIHNPPVDMSMSAMQDVTLAPTGSRINTSRHTTAVENPPADTICPICQDAKKEGEAMRKSHNCEHVFHLECLDEWVNGTQANSNKCPVCRTEICNEYRCQAPANPRPGPSGHGAAFLPSEFRPVDTHSESEMRSGWRHAFAPSVPPSEGHAAFAPPQHHTNGPVERRIYQNLYNDFHAFASRPNPEGGPHAFGSRD